MTQQSNKTDTPSRHEGRHDRLIQELEHDPYKARSKPPEPTRCPDCGAVFHRGRWQWGSVPADAHEEHCPACQRIRDRVPAGLLTLGGEFLAAHREEVLGAVRNVEEKAQAEHPLERIMYTEERDGEVVIAFTDPHLARGAGEALQHAYKGELDLQYSKEEVLLRVTWTR